MRFVLRFAFVCVAPLIPAILAEALAQTTPQNATLPGQELPSRTGYVLKAKTRLITVDLLATDSHGNAVRDLKPEEVQIVADGKKVEKTASFEFVDAKIRAEHRESADQGPGAVYSNMMPFEHLAVPPTVLIVDALNTAIPYQMQARKEMIRLLGTLPTDTPVAVFLLGDSLRLMQGFTTDPSLLRAAANNVISATVTGKDPVRAIPPDSVDDPDSPSNLLLETSNGQETSLSLALEDFEKEEYAANVDPRARTTLNSFLQIARYLSGIRGRKNVVWMSQSFPFAILPDGSTGRNSFYGIRTYGDQVQAVASALADAQIALYPADARGLEPIQSVTAAEMGAAPVRAQNGRPFDGGMSGPIEREQETIAHSLDTMDELAQDSGGKTCKNTNYVARCIRTALDDGASYYELAFYPQNVPWDGKYHKISVRSSRHGVHYVYRRGFYASDTATLVRSRKPEEVLRQACVDLLPSTSLHLFAQPLPVEGPTLRYRLLLPADAISVSDVGGSRQVDLQAIACQYGPRGLEGSDIEVQELKTTVSDENLQQLQSRGIDKTFSVRPASDVRRIRFVVLDVAAGLTGSIDVPATPAATVNAP